jgi:hypothetical protein
MKNLFLLSLLLFNICQLKGQQFDKQGAIKTKDGIMLYVNNGAESYTIKLKGKIELKNYPFIELNGNIFQLITYPKHKFGQSNEQILNAYFQWEHGYHEAELFKQKLRFTRKQIQYQNKRLQYWDFTPPKGPSIKLPVLKTCYLDFVHGETLYSFSFSSMDGNEKKAINLLTSLFESTTFYDKGIDIVKLQEEIINAKNVN